MQFANVLGHAYKMAGEPPGRTRMHLYNALHWSQAARQSLALLMASAEVVLKHETSTLRKSHNCISIYLKFSVGDYVREVTSPVKFGSDPMSGRDATWGQHIFFC